MTVSRRRVSVSAFVAAGLLVAVLLVVFVAPHASSSPDGLEKVAADQGIDKNTEKHASADSPLADYGVKDVDDARLSGGLAGVIGVGVTVVAGSTVFWAVRRRRTSKDVTPVSAGV